MKNILAAVFAFALVWACYEYTSPKNAFLLLTAFVVFSLAGIQEKFDHLNYRITQVDKEINSHIDDHIFDLEGNQEMWKTKD
jgi:hypothetical protein